MSSLLLSRGLLATYFGSIGLFLPLIRQDLGLTFSQAGALSSASTLVYALMQVPAGYLSDRIGPKRVLFAGFMGTSLLIVGFGFAGTFIVALVLLVAFGFFRAFAFAPGLVLAASWFPDDRRSTALGLTVSATFGFTMILSLGGPSLAEALGWRAVVVGAAALGIGAALLFGRVADDVPPKDAGVRAADGPGWLLRQRVMWWIGGIQFIRLAIVVSFSFWVPTLLVEDHGLNLRVAGLIVAGGAGATVLSNLVGGYLSDRYLRPLIVIRIALLTLCATSLTIATVDITAVVIVALLINALFVQSYFGPIFVLPLEFFGHRSEGLATGFGNFFANLGAFVFTFTLGAIRDATGSFSLGFAALSLVAFAGVLITLRLSRLHPQRTGPTEVSSS
jgi:sugar phosphate permease